MRILQFTLAALISLSACSASPTQPGDGGASGGSVALSGSVTESAPTTSTTLADAVVTLDGVNTGKSTTTDSAGNYSFTGLAQGTFNIAATKSGYQNGTRSVTLAGSQTGVAVTLRPTPRTIDETLTGSVSDADPVCGAVNFTTACKRHPFGTHHDGAITASVTWSGGADIDLQLWRGTFLLEQSAGSDPSESISAPATAGESYELRVVYYTGDNVANYSLVVSRPN